jgi:protease-4
MTARASRWLIALLLAVTFAYPADALAAKKVLRLKFDSAIAESPAPDNPLAILMSGGEKPRSLYEWIEEIDKAANDKDIAGAIMVIDEPAIAMAHVEELTRALKAFRAKGKKVYCYTDYAGNGTYALACAADHITLAENSELSITGLHAEAEYYKGLLDKLGLQMEMVHCGAYKSAMEPFVRTEPSKEAAENINWLLDGIYDRWIGLMSDGRKQTAEQIKGAVDAAPLLGAEALKRKLVDAVASWEEFSQMVRKEFGSDVTIVKNMKDDEDVDLEIDPQNPIAMFQQMQTVMGKLFGAKDDDDKPAVGVVYLEGPIMTGKSGGGLFGAGSAGSTTLRAALDKAADEKSVKAVVLRVNSPGGSALASDIIWKAATRLGKTKPLIVSMGSVAGSGGYYVAIPGDTIFAEETTLTGSIGVVGGKMNWKGLWEGKLGITTTEYTRGKNADLMASMRNWTDEERAKIMSYLDAVYDQFKGRITASRGPRIKGNLDDLAGGRVYTGKQALERGLVDKLGGLQDAIRFAADKAGMKDYRVMTLPKEKDFAEILKTILGKPSEDEYEVSTAMQYAGDPLLGPVLPLLEQLAPERAASLKRFLQQLAILQRERVSCFMPLELRIR